MSAFLNDGFCVGVNQCVGLYNERHFVLFLCVTSNALLALPLTALCSIYMTLATFCYAISGWRCVLAALGIPSDDDSWPYYSPPVFFIATYVLSVVLCLAVSIMTAFHVWGIACGETSVESADHEQYRRTAKTRGETFVNSYDLGWVYARRRMLYASSRALLQETEEPRAVLQHRPRWIVSLGFVWPGYSF